MTKQKPTPRTRTMRRPKDGKDPESLPTASQTVDAEVAQPAQDTAPQQPQPNESKPLRPMIDEESLLAEIDAMDDAGWAKLLGDTPSPLPEVGQSVEGRVVRVEASTVYVDIGGKAEGQLDASDLEEEVGPGDTIQATVVAASDQGIRLARKLAGHISHERMLQAMETGLSVDGVVESRNTGGFTIRLGSARGFCPISQIDRYAGEDLDAFLGQTLSFRVVEVRDGDIVVSHRVIQEEEDKQRAGQLWSSLEVGTTTEGVVAGIQDFGVFVDLGGVQGLVHRSELGWTDDTEPPTKGQKVQVQVLGVDREAKRISLSMKQPEGDPWNKAGGALAAGSTFDGKVVRLAPFGAFVQILPGVDGLLHISKISDRRLAHPKEVLKEGQQIQVTVQSIDPGSRKISLVMATDADEVVDVENVQSPEQSLGTFADLFGNLKVD